MLKLVHNWTIDRKVAETGKSSFCSKGLSHNTNMKFHDAFDLYDQDNNDHITAIEFCVE